jgi:hypothetical protein
MEAELRFQSFEEPGVFDAGCSFALAASETAVQSRGDDERCPAGHEPSSSVVLYRLARACGGAQVLYTPVECLVAEYAALLAGEVLRLLAMIISSRCRCPPAVATIEFRIGLGLQDPPVFVGPKGDARLLQR